MPHMPRSTLLRCHVPCSTPALRTLSRYEIERMTTKLGFGGHDNAAAELLMALADEDGSGDVT